MKKLMNDGAGPPAASGRNILRQGAWERYLFMLTGLMPFYYDFLLL
jgi:hypothetical protein